MSEPQDEPKNPPANPPAQTEKTTKIKVDINRDPEIEAIRSELEKTKLEKQKIEEQSLSDKKRLEEAKVAAEKELEEKKAILEQQALQEFDKEKSTILNSVKESRLTDEQKAEIEEKLQDPKNLEIVKSLVTMMVESIKSEEEEKKALEEKAQKKAPTGKAPFIPQDTSAEQFESPVAMVDELYKRAYEQPHLYTKQQQEDAKKKIDGLFNSLINGKSWSQLREGEKIPSHKLNIQACPKCNRTFIGELPPKCPTCGFNLSKTGNYMER